METAVQDFESRLRTLLGNRIGTREIGFLKTLICDKNEAPGVDCLFNLVADDDERVGYNALWVLTHLHSAFMPAIASHRDFLINKLLRTDHTGQKRLILNLLERLPVNKQNLRTDFLDYCLSKINSGEPYAIRSLCIKLAFKQCRLYPELLAEFKQVIGMIDVANESPAINAVVRNVRKQYEQHKTI